MRPYFCSIIFSAWSWSSIFFCIIILLNISNSFAAQICSNKLCNRDYLRELEKILWMTINLQRTELDHIWASNKIGLYKYSLEHVRCKYTYNLMLKKSKYLWKNLRPLKINFQYWIKTFKISFKKIWKPKNLINFNIFF